MLRRVTRAVDRREPAGDHRQHEEGVMRAALIVLLLAAAGAARAEGAAPAEAPAAVGTIRLPQGLIGGAAKGALLQVEDREAQPVRPTGTVQTAVDHRFSRSAVGSLGYLCGLTPSRNDIGAASSQEVAGTFLGGQLKVAF
jgi:hypothetical protein